ncbi:cupin domain-containing protein [Streptomyces sp. NBC_00237]|uniref:cupin domain-containing protein n=1 Tax=Streptomyces sp. NBC_00237 TaxID=2975687 RepID=UPI002258C284|nr:cupin domain-containing protein [Streptomyces sp. NBC_00237]MCX5205982.1 cupin domain-containing protein [Streptomyces sp. NBC_00237]
MTPATQRAVAPTAPQTAAPAAPEPSPPQPLDDLVAAREDVQSRLAQFSAEARWSTGDGPWSPRPASVPTLWRYRDLRPLALESARFARADDAALRVVSLVNPGTADRATAHVTSPNGSPSAVGHLYSGLQLQNPGESMTAHRHAASALRFVIEGSGAWTVVNGDRLEVGPNDFVITPGGTWHEHGTDAGDAPVIWQDGTDDPLVNALDANFFALHPDRHQSPGRIVNASLLEYGSGLLAPDTRRSGAASPLLLFPWDKTYTALRDLAQVSTGSPYDGVIMEYVNPATGGPVMPTIGAHMQLLRPGQPTLAHRHTGSVVYQVAEGRGHSVIAGQRFDWEKNDIFCVPSWAWHEHANDDESEDACLFSFHDFPALRSLGLYAEEALESGDGHQELHV